MIDGKPAISVIVNIYNEEQYLSQCIESLLSQTLSDIEIILVDDGSSDSSPDICRQYARFDNRITCVLKRNEGLVSARKDGLKKANGRYVAFVDGDDWVEDAWFERMYGAAIGARADVVAAGYKEDLLGNVQIGMNLVPLGVYSGEELADRVYSIMLNTGQLSRFGIFTYLWNKLFKKEALYDDLIRVDNSIFIGEDASSLYPTLLHAKVLAVVDNSGYHYRQRAGSMVKESYDRQNEYGRLLALASYLDNAFSMSDYYDIMLPQLRMFMLSQIMVRTDGFPDEADDSSCLFPFDMVDRGSRVVLFGAGTFGQHVYRRICGCGAVELILWIDERAREYRTLGLNVYDIDALTNVAYDYIFIAILDEEAREEAKSLLLDLGVAESSTVIASLDENKKSALLSKFGL